MSKKEENESKVFVTIRVDGDCFMRCDGESIDVELKANKVTKVDLNVGQHILEFISAHDSHVTVEKIVDYPERGRSYLELIKGFSNVTATPQMVEPKATGRNVPAYTLTVSEIKDTGKAYAAAREALGWAASVSTRKLSALPYDILTTTEKDTALRIYDILDNGGMIVEVSGTGASGKAIPDCLGIKKREKDRKAAERKAEEERQRQEALTQPLFLICTDYEFGFMDRSGKVVIPCKYENAHDFSEGLARVIFQDSICYINKLGQIMFMFKADDSGDFHDGMAWVKSKGEFVYFSIEGKQAINCTYRRAGDFHEGFANVDDGDIITKKGRKLFRVSHGFSDENRHFSEGYIPDFKKDVINSLYGLYRYLNIAGTPAIDYGSYGKAGDFHEGLAKVYHNTKKRWVFIDKKGSIMVPSEEYSKVGDFHEGFAKYERTDCAEIKHYGFINKSGSEVIHFSHFSREELYDIDFGDFSEGMAKIRCVKTGKFGFISDNGRIAIPQVYDYAEDFRDGLARVELNGKFGYIDKEGHAVNGIIYDVTAPHKDLSRRTSKLNTGAPKITSQTFKNCTGYDIEDCEFTIKGREEAVKKLSEYNDGETVRLPLGYAWFSGYVSVLGKKVFVTSEVGAQGMFKKIKFHHR